MTCVQCGHENIKDARFCANCGNELDRIGSSIKTKPCPSCHFGNLIDACFCSQCGGDFHHVVPQKKNQDHQKHQANEKGKRVDTKLKWRPALILGIILTSAMLYVSIPFFTENKSVKNPVPATEVKSGNPVLEANMFAVAEKFICSCGKCGEQSLEICKCETAIHERQFIRDALQSGMTPNEIIASVNTNFGWMKPEAAAAYDSTLRKSGKSTKLIIPSEVIIKKNIR